MKRRLFMVVFLIAAAIGLTGTKVCAAESKLTANQKNSAVNAEVGKNYSVAWKDNPCVNKISLNKRGMLTITASKVSHKSFGTLDMDVAVYDADGNMVWVCRDEKVTNPSFYVGLDAGTYYVTMEPRYINYVEGTVTNYSFAFTATQYAEVENNSTKETATPIKTDATYTGYLGSGFSLVGDNADSCDVYKVKLVKGKKYRLVTSATKGTTIEGWFRKANSTGKDIEDFYEMWTDGKAHVAPSTGYYYISVFNYNNEQYKYTIQMRTESNYPAKTNIQSLSGGKKSLVVKWKKVKCSGYQIQYADNKKMKKAVTKTVKKSGTVKYQVKKLKAKKKYYVRVRAYNTIKGKKYYSGWSKIKNVTTKK